LNFELPNNRNSIYVIIDILTLNYFKNMTNKEFFIKTVEEEAPKFRVAIEALPEDKHSHKVHEKSREAGNLAAQLALQWKAIAGILSKGAPDFNPHEMEKQSKDDMLSKFDAGMTQLQSELAAISEEDWENGEAGMGDMWKDKKYKMAWGFLFDAIHHRGQLATYLRAMGAIVPSIYGPSADTQS
jgi:uncharacterized damage-inducible protein DinB